MKNEITDTDRATARRVIRRHVGASEDALVFVVEHDRFLTNQIVSVGGLERVRVRRSAFAAACLAAAQGRAYAATLRGAK